MSFLGDLFGGIKPLLGGIAPLAGRAIGTYFGGPAGAAIGSGLGGMASNWLGGSSGQQSPQQPQQQASPQFPQSRSPSMPQDPRANQFAQENYNNYRQAQNSNVNGIPYGAPQQNGWQSFGSGMQNAFSDYLPQHLSSNSSFLGKALPILGSAVGNYFGGSTGGAIGGSLGGALGGGQGQRGMGALMGAGMSLPIGAFMNGVGMSGQGGRYLPSLGGMFGGGAGQGGGFMSSLGNMFNSSRMRDMFGGYAQRDPNQFNHDAMGVGQADNEAIGIGDYAGYNNPLGAGQGSVRGYSGRFGEDPSGQQRIFPQPQRPSSPQARPLTPQPQRPSSPSPMGDQGGNYSSLLPLLIGNIPRNPSLSTPPMDQNSGSGGGYYDDLLRQNEGFLRIPGGRFGGSSSGQTAFPPSSLSDEEIRQRSYVPPQSIPGFRMPSPPPMPLEWQGLPSMPPSIETMRAPSPTFNQYGGLYDKQNQKPAQDMSADRGDISNNFNNRPSSSLTDEEYNLRYPGYAAGGHIPARSLRDLTEMLGSYHSTPNYGSGMY